MVKLLTDFSVCMSLGARSGGWTRHILLPNLSANCIHTAKLPSIQAAISPLTHAAQISKGQHLQGAPLLTVALWLAVQMASLQESECRCYM